MAILSMERIHLCAMKRDRKNILEFLQRRGVVEVRDAGEADDVFEKTDTSVTRGLFEKNADTAQKALEIMNRYVPSDMPSLSFLRGRTAITAEVNDKFVRVRDSVLQVAQRIVQLERDVAEAKAEILRAKTQEEQLRPWLQLPVGQTFTGTRKTAAFIGTLEGEQTQASILLKLAAEAPALSALHVEIVSSKKEQTAFYVIVLKKDAEAAEAALRAIGFARPPSATHHLPEVKRQHLEARRLEADERLRKAEEEIKSYADRRADLRFLEDHFRMRTDKYEVIEQLKQSKHTFVLDGYVPTEDAPALEQGLNDTFTCAVQVFPAGMPGDEVPVKLKNNRFAEPTESVLESYSMPGKTDIDPTNVMAFFYYMMFGIMFGDAGYGLIMVVVCGICLLKFKNMEPNWNKNVRMFFWCGAFTMFWGVMFSSYFGNVVDIVSQTFFGKLVSIPPVLFYIDQKPMLMLVISLAIGIIHLSAGFVMKGITNVKNGDKIGVLYDTVFPILAWYPLMVVLVGSEMFGNLAGFKADWPPIVTPVCFGVTGVALVGILLTSGRESRRWSIRLLKGAYGIYNTLSGWLSDMLSYSRLLALGLASGVIASVMNELGSMAGGGVGGVILFVIVFALGQGMNFGINVLGAYVHSNRLEYIEFFGKFYEGGGRKFTPFGINTKYYKIQEEVQNAK